MKSLCPICLKYREAFEEHHVIWKNDHDGGSNDFINLLDICKTCHAILTFGEWESAWYDRACVAHQMASYGLNFELRCRKDISKSDFLKKFIEAIRLDFKIDCRKADEYIRKIGIAQYNVAMGVIHGIITEDEVYDHEDSVAEKLICPVKLLPTKQIKTAATNNFKVSQSYQPSLF